MSESFRRLLPMAAHESKELRGSLLKSERELFRHSKTIAQIIEAATCGDSRMAFQLHEKLPPSLQHDKLILFQRLRAVQPQSREEYFRVPNDCRAYYPDGLSLDLLLIDLYRMTKEYDKGLLSIDRIVEATGGDPYLTALKAVVYYENNDLQRANGLQDNNLPQILFVSCTIYEIVCVCRTRKLSNGFVTNISQSSRTWVNEADRDGPRRKRGRWVGAASPRSPWPLESPIGLFAMESVNSTIPTRFRRTARGSLVPGAVPEKRRSRV